MHSMKYTSQVRPPRLSHSSPGFESGISVPSGVTGLCHKDVMSCHVMSCHKDNKRKIFFIRFLKRVRLFCILITFLYDVSVF